MAGKTQHEYHFTCHHGFGHVSPSARGYDRKAEAGVCNLAVGYLHLLTVFRPMFSILTSAISSRLPILSYPPRASRHQSFSQPLDRSCPISPASLCFVVVCSC